MGGVIGLESDSFATHKTMCIFEKVPNFFIPSVTDKNLFQHVSANYYLQCFKNEKYHLMANSVILS